jgi:Helicase
MRKNSLLRYRLDPASIFEDVGDDKHGPPYPWQINALRSPSRRQLYLTTRQGGKSSVAATKSLHVAMFTPGSLVLMVSPSQKQSEEIIRKARNAYRLLGRPMGVAAEGTRHIELANGSRIESLPGTEKSNVGYTAALVVIDEAARTDSELIEALMPTVAVSGGSVIALSTPKGARGWFYELWHSPQVYTIWERHRATADDVPSAELAAMVEEAMVTRGPLGTCRRITFVQLRRRSPSAATLQSATSSGREHPAGRSLSPQPPRCHLCRR